MHPPNSQPPPNKAGLKAWWASFTSAQKVKKDAEARRGERCNMVNNSSSADSRRLAEEPVHVVFGKPLKESLKYASVQISTANSNGELYVWGYIPVVVAKWYAEICFPWTLKLMQMFFTQRTIFKGER
jgi:GTPase-activating protein SAC7